MDKYPIEGRYYRCKGIQMESTTDAESAGGPQPHDIKQAISAYTQSEKVKSGLIWITQVAEHVAQMDGPGRRQGMLLLKTLAHMVADEADLAGRITGKRSWHDIAKKINLALVMINSGVPEETGYHLARALTLVTRIGGQAASALKSRGLF
jgi:hypothetical protein